MKIPLILLFLFFASFAGTNTAWSNYFSLEEAIGVENSTPAQTTLSLSFKTSQFSKSISFIIQSSVQQKQGSLRIYNMSGKLINSFKLAASKKQHLAWNLNNLSGKPVTSGVYIGKLSIGSETFNKAFVLLK